LIYDNDKQQIYTIYSYHATDFELTTAQESYETEAKCSIGYKERFYKCLPTRPGRATRVCSGSGPGLTSPIIITVPSCPTKGKHTSRIDSRITSFLTCMPFDVNSIIFNHDAPNNFYVSHTLRL